MLEKEFQYFKENQDELVSHYLGKFIVIEGSEVKGAFATAEEAYLWVVQNQKLGLSLIQQCVPGKEAYTQTFHSRVTF